MIFLGYWIVIQMLDGWPFAHDKIMRISDVEYHGDLQGSLTKSKPKANKL